VKTKGLIDFHCHLDLYPDYAEAVAECEQRGVFTLSVTTTPRAWPRNKALASTTRYVRAALGLHPQLVAEYAGELTVWESYLPQARYIGEVGLDAGPRFFRSFELQKQVFERILRACADARGKILTVHSVRAASAVLDLIKINLPASRGRVVLHWFTGSQAEARRALDLGCYFSINAEMLSNQRHRTIIAALPLDRLLTETDGPFTKVAGRPSRPSDVIATVDALSRLRGIDFNATAVAIRENLRQLLSEIEPGNGD
jgi:TatD DNase family protein